MMSSAVRPECDSGFMPNTIPGSAEKCSASERNRCSACHRNPVRLQAGILFAFRPESCSAWSGIPIQIAKMQQKDITAGQIFAGIEPGRIVKVVAAIPKDSGCWHLVYRSEDGSVKEKVILKEQLARFSHQPFLTSSKSEKAKVWRNCREFEKRKK